jgi:serine protease Do
MKSTGFFGMTVMLSAAVGLGALVATVAPRAGAGTGSGAGATALAPASIDSSQLKLAPPPPPAAAVAPPSFADLAERAIPSVVQIASISYVTDQQDPHEMFRDNPLFRRFFEEEQQQPEGEPDTEPPPRSRPQQSGGSGFFFTTDGYIMTNRHVVEKSEELRVRTSDDREFEAKLVGVDPYLDLAVIKIESDQPVAALPLGNSDALRVGEWVVAIGNPIMYRNSVTAGVVSGKGRRLGFDATELGDYIQTDAAINFGNSGGPLLNARGEVIGINTAIVRNDNPFRGREGLIEGIGFALPIEAARRSLDQLVSTGTVRRGYLGVSVGPLSADGASFNGLPDNKGAVVQRVDPDTPAAKAGVQQADVILAVDGRPVSNSTELVSAISAKRPGDSVRLEVWRYDTQAKTGQKLAFNVTLAERRIGLEEQEGRAAPTPAPRETESETSLGLTVRPVRPEMREPLEKRGIRGVLVTEVDPASNAYREGLRPGAVITDVNGKPTPSVADFRAVVQGIKPGDVVRVIVRTTDGGDQGLIFFRAPAAKK